MRDPAAIEQRLEKMMALWMVCCISVETICRCNGTGALELQATIDLQCSIVSLPLQVLDLH